MFYLWMVLIGLHVLFAIMWLGGNIIMTILVGPALAGAAVASQADVGARLGQQAPRIFRPIAVLTIVLGMVIGAHMGALASWASIVTSLYGRTYLTALVLSIAVFAYGEFVVGRLAAQIARVPDAERPAAIGRTLRATAFEKILFLAILACMILLRFGL